MVDDTRVGALLFRVLRNEMSNTLTPDQQFKFLRELEEAAAAAEVLE